MDDTAIFLVQHASFQDAELKLHMYVFSQLQVVGRLTILPYPGGVKNKGLIAQKT